VFWIEVIFYGTELLAYFVATEGGKRDGEGAIAVVIDKTPFAQARKVVLDNPKLFIRSLKIWLRCSSSQSLSAHRKRVFGYGVAVFTYRW
jgi:hypothetical protein